MIEYSFDNHQTNESYGSKNLATFMSALEASLAKHDMTFETFGTTRGEVYENLELGDDAGLSLGGRWGVWRGASPAMIAAVSANDERTTDESGEA